MGASWVILLWHHQRVIVYVSVIEIFSFCHVFHDMVSPILNFSNPMNFPTFFWQKRMFSVWTGFKTIFWLVPRWRTGEPMKPYYKKFLFQCFTCVICGKSLDGIPFTVDASNQIHCIDDFHKRFAPKCSVCKSPIMPEPGVEETVRVVALDRSFHVKGYKCEDCGLELSSEAKGRGCYPLDDHVFCKRCNTNRIQRLTQGI